MMEKLFTLEILVLILFLYVKNGESLKCFICRSDTDAECGNSVNSSYSKDCPAKYCRKISQLLKFKNEKNPTLIRECAKEKGDGPCYRFNWLSLAKQTTCECDKDNCNRGINYLPKVLTTLVLSSLALVYGFVS